MSDPIIDKFYDYLYDGSLIELKSLIEENPILKEEIDFDLISQFTKEDEFEILKFLLNYQDVNIHSSDDNLFTKCCWRDVSVENLKWLIHKGIDINFKDLKANSNAINIAIIYRNLEVVKFLVEKGVEYQHLSFRFEGTGGEITHVQTVVDVALMFNQKEIAEYFISLGVQPASKEQIEKHVPSKISFISKLFKKKVNEQKEFEEYLENEIGDFKRIFSGKKNEVDILLIEPNEYQSWQTLITYGVSKQAMKTDDEDLKYCEIAIQLPSDWPLDKNSLKNPEYFWPVEWLRDMSVYPFQNDVLIKDQDTIAGDGSAFASNTKLNSFFIMQDPEFHGLMLSNRKFINFYTLIPLYQEECDDIRKNGVVPVITKFEENLIGQTVEIDRPNVITGEGL